MVKFSKLSIMLMMIMLLVSLLDWMTILSGALQILSKSKLQKCEKSSNEQQHSHLNCTFKILVNLAVPTSSSGGEASMVAEIVEVEENSTNKMQNLRVPPVITVNKSAAYALFQLMYIRDVPYKPQEFYVKTRKCEPDAGAHVVQICERLRDDQGHIIEATQPVCCPCGDRRRVPSSCGNFFDKLVKGKANTAHCLRFPGDWFHIFGIGQRSVGFSIRIKVKTGVKETEVVIGPENRTAVSHDSFLRVNLVGDFAGYTNIPSFEDFYLVTPRQGGPGQPPSLGRNFTMWMLLERVRFTLDGLECNKIGVSYEAFNGQPDFCSSPFWSCLHNQLWNFHEADMNRFGRNQPPLYGVGGRYERINEHPNAGSSSFSIGITETLNTNLLIEIAADDIDYVNQRSPGKILGVTVPTFETLAQFGTAKITSKNIGKVEASYSLTFDCSEGISQMEEQFFIMKPDEVVVRSFRVDPTTDQAAKYSCAAILKDSEFNEVDRAECQFTTTATVIDNGTQGVPFTPPKSNIKGFFQSIKEIWNKFWDGLSDFITGKSCRSKCGGFFDFHCHIQYVCISWVVMFGLFLSIFPTALVLLWLLHQKGLFDPLYDWWEDHCLQSNPMHNNIKRRHEIDTDHYRNHHKKHKGQHHHRHDDKYNRHRRAHGEHGHHRAHRLNDYNHHLHHVHREKKHKHGHHKRGASFEHVQIGNEDAVRRHKHRKDNKRDIKRTTKLHRHNIDSHEFYDDEDAAKRRMFEDGKSRMRNKRRE